MNKPRPSIVGWSAALAVCALASIAEASNPLAGFSGGNPKRGLSTGSVAGLPAPTCNFFEEPGYTDCFVNGDCFCDVEEGASLEFFITFEDSGLHVCLWADDATIPPGATFPPADALDFVQSDFAWMPNNCQEGIYTLTILGNVSPSLEDDCFVTDGAGVLVIDITVHDTLDCTIPTVSEWGIVVMTFVLLSAGTIVLRNRVHAAA